MTIYTEKITPDRVNEMSPLNRPDGVIISGSDVATDNKNTDLVTTAVLPSSAKPTAGAPTP